MTTVERISSNELEKLSMLYYQLDEMESNLKKMKNAFLNIENNPDYYLLGVKFGKELVGTAMAIICYDLYCECKPFMVIENVIVDKEYQRKGYGTILFNEIESIAKTRDCYFIMLLSNRKRNNSHRFYRKLGYVSDDNLAFKKYL